MFKNDLLKDHVRERFHVTAPGIPDYTTGILIKVAKTNLEFADVKVRGEPAPSPLYVDRHPGTYLQKVSDAPG